jgi:putative membrane protein
MKFNRTFLPLLLVCLMAVFNTACQRNDNGVQAAREDKMAPAGTSDKNMMSAEDQNIATKIEESHQGEVDLARWAKDHASNSDVKDYADMIADDHTSAMKDLNNLMQDKHAAGAPEQKPAEARADLSKLENLSGPEFDRQFMNMMVTDHQKTIDNLRNFQMQAQNPDLKDYINDLIPKVQKHLEKAQDLQSKMTQTGAR